MLLKAVLEGRVAAHDEGRHRLGHLVTHGIRITEHACGVSDRGSRLDLGERHNLCHIVSSIALRRVADHLVSISGVEVHVDVRHRDASGIQETFEQKVVFDRVEIGDPEGVGHRTTGSRPTARAHTNVVVPGMFDEVPGDQEICREPHAVNDTKLIVDAVDHISIEVIAPAFVGTLICQVAQIFGVGGEAVRKRKLWKLRLTKFDLDVASFSDPERVVARRRDLGEEPAHLPRRL